MKQSTSLVPGHLAVIMDGNGRWAERRGRPRWMGHVAGARVVKEVVAHCARAGVGDLTLYAFSADNWSRPVEEVGALLSLFESHLQLQTGRLEKAGIRLSVIGRRDRLPLPLLRAIREAERRTGRGCGMHLRVAVDYSSRAAIERALPGTIVIPVPARAGTVAEAELLPPVDLLLRTGGERRLSDFLLWECAYAELLFIDTLWPDVTPATLDAAFRDFAARERRFGAVPARRVSA